MTDARAFVVGRACFDPRPSAPNVTPLFTGPRVVAEGRSPAQRVVRAHRIIEDAARELHSGDRGSGLRLLGHAMATHLALTVGQAEAGAFFNLLATLAADTRAPDPESAA